MGRLVPAGSVHMGIDMALPISGQRGSVAVAQTQAGATTAASCTRWAASTPLQTYEMWGC